MSAASVPCSRSTVVARPLIGLSSYTFDDMCQGRRGLAFIYTRLVIHDLWYKNAVIYCLNVETYVDSNGDGVGDFAGLTDKLAYLAGLGITCIWLLPFYASPDKDDGYDVSDYYGVHPRTGTFGD